MNRIRVMNWADDEEADAPLLPLYVRTEEYTHVQKEVPVIPYTDHRPPRQDYHRPPRQDYNRQADHRQDYNRQEATRRHSQKPQRHPNACASLNCPYTKHPNPPVEWSETQKLYCCGWGMKHGCKFHGGSCQG